MDEKRDEPDKKWLAEFVSALDQAELLSKAPFPEELAKLIDKEVSTAEDWKYIGFPPSHDPNTEH